jgi:osmotically inducible protein OsmC
MAVQRTAEVTWENDLLNGRGKVRFGSGAIPEASVSWAARTEKPDGKTSPEELLAGAHASCYSMALSGTLARNRTPPKRLDVKATATFDKVGDAWKVTTMELAVKAEVPGIDAGRFVELATVAKDTCPISQALKNNVEIKLSAQLV